MPTILYTQLMDAMKNKSDVMPIEKIVDENNVEVFKAMVSAAKSKNLLAEFLTFKGAQDKTILHLAIAEQKPELVDEILVSIRELPNDQIERVILAQDKFKNSPMHWAVDSSDKASALKLIDVAESAPGLLEKMILAQDDSGNTAFHLSISDEKEEITEVILAAVISNADLLMRVLNKENHLGVTILETIIVDDNQALFVEVLKSVVKFDLVKEFAAFKNKAGKDLLQIAEKEEAEKITAELTKILSTIAQDEEVKSEDDQVVSAPKEKFKLVDQADVIKLADALWSAQHHHSLVLKMKVLEQSIKNQSPVKEKAEELKAFVQQSSGLNGNKKAACLGVKNSAETPYCRFNDIKKEIANPTKVEIWLKQFSNMDKIYPLEDAKHDFALAKKIVSDAGCAANVQSCFKDAINDQFCIDTTHAKTNAYQVLCAEGLSFDLFD